MDFVRDNPGEPVPEETFTHSHLSWSSVVPYLLHPSTAIQGIPPVQCRVKMKKDIHVYSGLYFDMFLAGVYPAYKLIFRSNSWLSFHYEILAKMMWSVTVIGNGGCNYCPV